ncbi:MAG: hypothetical protein ACI4XC_05385 [Eubacterium sp.]
MNFADSKAISFYKMICALTVGFFILLSFCTTAYAYDENYVGNNKYWNDRGEIVNISNNNFDGCFKYFVDEENGCIYFYLNFYDSLLTEKSDDASLIFNFKNSENIYSVSVSKDGINADESSIIDKSFDIYYDFGRVKPKYHGGEIYVAFEFKNSEDKKLDSTVSCEYSCGKDNNFLIKNDIAVNMSKTATTKTTKATTEKSTAAKTTKQSTANNLSSSTVKKTTEKATKFTPSTTKNSASNKSNGTTKFSAKNDYEGENGDISAKPYESDTFAPNDLISADGASSALSEKESSQLNHRTTAGKALFAFGIAAFVLGVFLIFYGALNGKFKIVKSDDLKEQADDTEE